MLDEEWRAAAFAEFDAHVSNKTFQHVDCPASGHKVLRMHPIFSYKYDEHGDIARYKARFVVNGSEQVCGESYFETFAPTLSKEFSGFLSSTPSRLVDL